MIAWAFDPVIAWAFRAPYDPTTMRILVPIKQVPETNAVRMDEETGTMVREGVEAIVNPLDLYAIELAIRLREQAGGQVTCITMGPPNAAKALREAVSMGVDDGVLVTGKEFAGADTWATSYVLAAAIRKLGGFDLVLCGERATDGDTGQVGPGVAAFLDIPVASYVGKVEPPSGDALRVHRLIEDGYEILDVEMPCALTVVKEVSDPRLPTLRGKLKAKALELTQWSVADLDVDVAKLGLKGSPTRVVRIHRPQVARQCEKIVVEDEAGAAKAADRVVAFLKDKEIL